jgi:hypothetical protein
MDPTGSGAGTNTDHNGDQRAEPLGSRIVAEGFVLEQLDTRWALLRHDSCRKSTRLVNPTADRVGWYLRTHCCAPAGTTWDGTAAGYYPHETCALVRYLSWLVSATGPETFADPACNTAARDAIDVLQATLVAAESARRR